MTGPARPLMGKDKTSDRQIDRQAKEGNMLSGEKDVKHKRQSFRNIKRVLESKKKQQF
jgi:hypothetical protein